jgi:hypothetical protein
MGNQSNDKAEIGVRVGMITPQNQNPQKSIGNFINQNQKPSQILLKGKLGLPDGFGPLKPYQKLLAKNGEDNDSLGEDCIFLCATPTFKSSLYVHLDICLFSLIKKT